MRGNALNEASMSLINVVSVELPKYEEALPQWKDALSACVGRVSTSLKDQESTHCVPVGVRPFSGRIECAALGDIILAKLMATANHFQRSLLTETPTLPVPVLLFIQLSGSNRFDQHGRSSTLHPGDWCLIDTLYPFDSWSLGAGVEVLVLTLGRPADADLLGLLEQGVARRWDGRTGMSRVLQCTVLETFEQMNRLALSSRTNLDRAITDMVWAALREQIETPAGLGHQQRQCARIKRYIEAQLDDAELSVNSIAHACGMSVRSIHRAFASDPAGSVSNYIWLRRLSHCAATLRDPGQARRPITEVCFSWGFKSTSHFSRLFKERFGVPPREYRPPA
jgi:AraC-like DNA-binding protein